MQDDTNVFKIELERRVGWFSPCTFITSEDENFRCISAGWLLGVVVQMVPRRASPSHSLCSGVTSKILDYKVGNGFHIVRERDIYMN